MEPVFAGQFCNNREKNNDSVGKQGKRGVFFVLTIREIAAITMLYRDCSALFPFRPYQGTIRVRTGAIKPRSGIKHMNIRGMHCVPAIGLGWPFDSAVRRLTS